MFQSFFLNRKWLAWSVLGSILILATTWYKVQVDVDINRWYGSFFDLVQQALTKPGSVTFDAYNEQMLVFLKIVSVYIVIVVILEFFIKHYVFRWRTAMNDFYMANWHKVRHVEGASQRVQDDTMRFARILESLGVSFMRSIMTLIAFLPILWELSEKITELPYFGPVEHSLVYLALISAAFGTVVLAAVGLKLPGLEFKNQLVEAAYRKELVFGEDAADRADPPTTKELFKNVRKNYFRLYFHYLYFDIVRWSYLQGSVLFPLIAMGPTIIAGAITYGLMQRILQAFNKVESSFQYLVNAWPTIVEFISIYKRLRAFEEVIRDGDSSRGQTAGEQA